MSTPQTVVITGPTASGKTAVALQVAQQLPCEIISADSALIYRGMDIGTAKPTAAEQSQVPHHLIDIIDPTESYSTARFVEDVQRIIQEIHARERHALVVGGTMLYLKAWLEGIDDLPATTPEVRSAVQLQALEHGWPAMHAKLTQVDPITAARLSPNDSQRIGRALEVFQMTGQPLSALHTRARASALPLQPIPMVSLEPVHRSWLHERIALRTETMWNAGFVAEFERLSQWPGIQADSPAMRCVGYRQATETVYSCGNLHTPEAAILWKTLTSAATRQLAKRQLTWLRSMPSRQIVAADDEKALLQATQTVIERLSRA
ncbi:MAG: tRNA ((37)-N6)-dimethylallyltransferase MiaA [Pseudomonadota bacterium]